MFVPTGLPRCRMTITPDAPDHPSASRAWEHFSSMGSPWCGGTACSWRTRPCCTRPILCAAPNSVASTSPPAPATVRWWRNSVATSRRWYCRRHYRPTRSLRRLSARRLGAGRAHRTDAARWLPGAGLVQDTCVRRCAAHAAVRPDAPRSRLFGVGGARAHPRAEGTDARTGQLGYHTRHQAASAHSGADERQRAELGGCAARAGRDRHRRGAVGRPAIGVSGALLRPGGHPGAAAGARVFGVRAVLRSEHVAQNHPQPPLSTVSGRGAGECAAARRPFGCAVGGRVRAAAARRQTGGCRGRAAVRRPQGVSAGAAALRRTSRSVSPPSASALSIHFAKHQIERTHHGHDVGDHMAAGHHVQSAEVGKAGRTNVHTVRPVGAVRDHVHALLAFGRLHRRIRLAGGHHGALGEELEKMNERLHGRFHVVPARRGDFAVVHAHLPVRHLVQTL
eukprot:ctg_434.g228